ncbi:MAG: hypothetical protein GY925_08025 [Actinomycetia bacterium]|nr:hypothetical protein [Actinomycetes bacterium]
MKRYIALALGFALFAVVFTYTPGEAASQPAHMQLDQDLRARGMSLVDPDYVEIADMAVEPLSIELDQADLVVRGTVRGVGSAEWNSVDGKEYVEDLSRSVVVAPMQFRRVTFEVAEVLKGDTGTTTVSFIVWGSGESADSTVIDIGGQWVVANRAAGEFAEGQEKLLFLRSIERIAFGQEEKPIVELVLSGHHRGHWDVTDSGLANLDPGRSVARSAEFLNLIRDRVAGGHDLDELERHHATDVAPLGVANPVDGSEKGNVRLVIQGGEFWCEGPGCAASSRQPSPLPPASESQAVVAAKTP